MLVTKECIKLEFKALSDGEDHSLIVTEGTNEYTLDFHIAWTEDDYPSYSIKGEEFVESLEEKIILGSDVYKQFHERIKVLIQTSNAYATYRGLGPDDFWTNEIMGYSG